PPPPSATPFPYTTLFRSAARHRGAGDSTAPTRRGAIASAHARKGSYAQQLGRAAHGRQTRFTAARSAGADDSSVRDQRGIRGARSEEHTSELQSRDHLVC